MYRVEVASEAATTFRGIAHTHRERVRMRVRALAGGLTNYATQKLLRHRQGGFVRVRAGRFVAMCDVIEADEVVLVLGIELADRRMSW
jgi:mRNA-degrading endonuclease RelE of RelBE toxin-antitoxin system